MTKHIDKSVYLREAFDLAARVWVLTGAKPTKHYTYIEGRWAEISIRYNGEEAPPKRRVDDAAKELRELEPKESRLDALTSDRSIDA